MFRFLLLALALTACSNEAKKDSPRSYYEDYGDIYAANGNTFFVNASTHKEGWGHRECFLCHNINNIHLVDRTKDLTIDLNAVREAVEREGETSCFRCHGANGTDVEIPAPNPNATPTP